MSRKLDPRPARTRALLFDALVQLIQEKRWERIRVQDILDRSGVGRSTFYAHFDNKFDLFTAEIPKLTVPITDAAGAPDLLPLFEHVHEMQPVMSPLMSQPLLGEIMNTFHQRLAEAWNEHLTELGVTDLPATIASEALAGALLSVARRWLIDGCNPNPLEMSQAFEGYAFSIIDQAIAGPPVQRARTTPSWGAERSGPGRWTGPPTNSAISATTKPTTAGS